MQLPAYQTERVRHIATATALSRCGEEHQRFWQLIFQETEVQLGYQALFLYKQPGDLAFSNTEPNINRKTALKMCFNGCARITE
jgi:hypothetical protein